MVARPHSYTRGRMIDRPEGSLRRKALQGLFVASSLVACGGGSDDAPAPAPAPVPGNAALTITQPAAFAAGLIGAVAVQVVATNPSVASVEFQIDGAALSIDTA